MGRCSVPVGIDISPGVPAYRMVPRIRLITMSDALRSVHRARVSKPLSYVARRKRHSEEIFRRGVEMPFPCSFCTRTARRCFLSEKSANCAECVRAGKSCDIGLSDLQLKRLDQAKEDLKKQLEEAEDREVEARANARRIRKQLASVNTRQREMFAKELAVIEKLEELDRVDAERGAVPVVEASLLHAEGVPTTGVQANESVAGVAGQRSEVADESGSLFPFGKRFPENRLARL